jgi:hypothetical protein
MHKVSDLILEKYLKRQLSTKDMEEIKVSIESDVLLKNRFAALQKSDIDFKQKVYDPDFIIKLKTTVKKKYITYFITISSVMSVLLVSLYVGISYFSSTSNISDQIELSRLKGNKQSLHIYKKEKNGLSLLKDKSVVSAGNVLQISYLSESHKYLMILSVDGNGVITRHFPYDKDEATQISANVETSLKYSYELDDAPEFERFFYISSSNPFQYLYIEKMIKKNIAQVKNSIEIDLPDGYYQESILLLKK